MKKFTLCLIAIMHFPIFTTPIVEEDDNDNESYEYRLGIRHSADSSSRREKVNSTNTTLFNPHFVMIQQPEKGWKSHLQDAGWQIGTTVFAHVATHALTNAYDRWNRPDELKAAEAIQINNALEEQINGLRQIIGGFYNFMVNPDYKEKEVRQNFDCKVDPKKLKSKTLIAFANISTEHIKAILPILKKLNGIKTQYEFEDNNEEKETYLNKFTEEFNKLLETINGQPCTSRIRSNLEKGIRHAKDAVVNHRNGILLATDAAVLAAPIIMMLTNNSTQSDEI